MKKNQWLPLIGIILCAVFLRFWMLGRIPEGLHADEAAFGYNAYSILKTGHDEHGVAFPLMLNIFGISIGAVYSYLTIPFVYVFGLNEWAVRAPTAVAGLFFIVVVFAMIRQLTRNNILALITAAVFSIAPTSVFLSRVQSDPLVAGLFMYAAALFYLLYIRSDKIRYVSVCAVSALCSLFTHQATYVLVPLLLGLLTLFTLRQANTRQRAVSALLIVVLLFVSFWAYTKTAGRVSQLSFIMSPQVTIPLYSGLSEDGILHVPVALSRVFHNKIMVHGRNIIESVGKYWSVDFLFIQAAQPMREAVPGVGFLYLLEFPLLIFGFYKSMKHFRPLSLFLLAWLIFGTVVISTALDESPSIHRFYYVAFPMYFYISVGIWDLWQTKFFLLGRRLPVRVLLFGGYAISLILFLHQLFIHQPTHQPYWRGYAYKELVQKIVSLQKKYQAIVFTKSQSSPYIYYLFYTRYDPEAYQKLGSPRDVEGTPIGTIIYTGEACPSAAPEFQKYKTANSNALFINRGDCVETAGAQVIDTVRWRDSLRAFQLVTFSSTASAGKMQ